MLNLTTQSHYSRYQARTPMVKTLVTMTSWIVAIVLAALFALNLLLDRPPSFALEQVVNHLYRKGDGMPRQLAGRLIQAGWVKDWARPGDNPSPAPPFPALLSAASPRNSYPYQTYSAAGRPTALLPGPFLPPAGTRMVNVATATAIVAAIGNALPGDIITIAPGSYNIRAWSIPVAAAGSMSAPIYLRSARFGTVLLNLNALEGFLVLAPFWVFENLRIRGTCDDDSSCEHAFHVVGDGKSFTLRNSEVFNFNAPVKVNLQPVDGSNHYADNGLLEYNSFYNEAPRRTGNPVTLLNIDAADGWVVRGNYIADFAKNGGDHVSYGAFMKGNARGGIFERNLVICEHRLPADEGNRVGLSFGGGASGTRFCRQQSCTVEFSEGIMRNNIIMNCSRDVGIYLNRAADSQIYHNLLYNNLGIDVRFETSSAHIANNIISGRISNRDDGKSTQAGNVMARDCLGSTRTGCKLHEVYQSPERADFRLKRLESRIWQPVQTPPGITEDFCGRPLTGEVNVGPIQYLNGLDCLALAPAEESG